MSWTACPYSGKRGFVTRADAERALHQAQKRFRASRRRRVTANRLERRIYDDCPCGRFHLTSMSKLAA